MEEYIILNYSSFFRNKKYLLSSEIRNIQFYEICCQKISHTLYLFFSLVHWNMFASGCLCFGPHRFWSINMAAKFFKIQQIQIISSVN